MGSQRRAKNFAPKGNQGRNITIKSENLPNIPLCGIYRTEGLSRVVLDRLGKGFNILVEFWSIIMKHGGRRPRTALGEGAKISPRGDFTPSEMAAERRHFGSTGG